MIDGLRQGGRISGFDTSTEGRGVNFSRELRVLTMSKECRDELGRECSVKARFVLTVLDPSSPFVSGR
jgi:hypothetical protein